MSANFEYYKVFYYVAGCKSITHAAKLLYMTQPAVTRIIQNLESQLNCRLFIRSKRGVDLTSEGKQLYEQISPACRMIFVAENELADINVGNLSSVRISATNLAIGSYVGPILEQFCKEHPKAQLSIYHDPSSQTRWLLSSGLRDMIVDFDGNIEDGQEDGNGNTIAMINTTEQNIYIKKLGTFKDVAVAGKEYSYLAGRVLTTEELAHYPRILALDDRHHERYYTKLFSEYRKISPPDIRVANFTLRRYLVRQNFGISFMTSDFFDGIYTDGDFIQLETDAQLLQRHMVIMTGNPNNLSDAAQTMYRLILAQADK